MSLLAEWESRYGGHRPLPVAEVPLKKGGKVWLVGDVQWGHIDVDKTKFKSHLKRAREEGWRVVSIGDLVENVSMSSKVARYGALHEQESEDGVPTLNKQMREMLELLRGLPIDGHVTGNHESRSLSAAFDPAMAMADAFGCLYLEDGGFVVYHTSGGPVPIFVHHGEGPVVSPVTLFDRLERNHPGCAVYAAGHTHHLLAQAITVATWQGMKPVWRVRTGSYLRYPRYATRRPIIPSSETGSALLTISPKGGVRVELLT